MTALSTRVDSIVFSKPWVGTSALLNVQFTAIGRGQMLRGASKFLLWETQVLLSSESMQKWFPILQTGYNGIKAYKHIRRKLDETANFGNNPRSG
ncbi:hypothetical protein D3C75_1071630 [compost metagenome]